MVKNGFCTNIEFKSGINCLISIIYYDNENNMEVLLFHDSINKHKIQFDRNNPFQVKMFYHEQCTAFFKPLDECIIFSFPK